MQRRKRKGKGGTWKRRRQERDDAPPLPQTSRSRHPPPPALLFFVRFGTGTGMGTGSAALRLPRARLPCALPLRPIEVGALQHSRAVVPEHPYTVSHKQSLSIPKETTHPHYTRTLHNTPRCSHSPNSSPNSHTAHISSNAKQKYDAARRPQEGTLHPSPRRRSRRIRSRSLLQHRWALRRRCLAR
jgi:hypothetical protein